MKGARQSRILELLDECEELPLGEIARRIGRISEVTVRRDVVELAEAGRLIRRRGGAVRLGRHDVSAGDTAGGGVPGGIGEVDAMVFAPIEGRGAQTLRMMARRRRIPFLAESAPQDFGTYLGPDNFAAGRELGNRAGRTLSGEFDAISLLVVSIEQLPNTRARCDGFEKGLRETFRGAVRHRRIDSRGSYRIAFDGAMDAMQVHPEINVVFGINDHAILAGLDAARELGLQVAGYSMGGEGGKLYDALTEGGPLRACGALFPEVVGTLAIDVLAGALRGEGLSDKVATPHAVLTPETLGDYYARSDEGWTLRPDALHRLAPSLVDRPSPLPAVQGRRPRIGFAPHYPAHDWYRRMERAMRDRAESFGIALTVAEPQAGIAREIATLRRIIARRAVAALVPGETVLLNAGPLAGFVAAELREARDLTVVTNSLDVLEALSGAPGLRLLLTSGELHADRRCLVGPSLGALFETLRADKTLLSVDGLSARFGVSAKDERLALAARRFAAAARTTIVLADHSIVGLDATHRIIGLKAVAQVITDSGTLPNDRLAISQTGPLLSLADVEDAKGQARMEGRIE